MMVRQTERPSPIPSFFVVKKRSKTCSMFFLRNAATTIGNGYPHCAVLRLRSDKQSALRRIMIGHRFAAIHHQVKQYLLKLDPVTGDCGQILREVSIHGYVSIDEIAAH